MSHPRKQLTMDPDEALQGKIHIFRGKKVLLDSDLAKIYGISTARLNQQVRRNLKRFPEDFAFLLTQTEFESLMLQIATSKQGRGGRRKRPFVFTEHGAVMAATILNTAQAIAMSVYVVRAFIKLREVLSGNRELDKVLSTLERRLTARLDTHEEAILQLFAEIRELLNLPPPQPGKSKPNIGFK